MFKKITTIAAISTLAACSTPFDADDLNGEAKTPSMLDAFSKTAIEDQIGLGFADVASKAIKSIEVGPFSKSQVLTVPDVSKPKQIELADYQISAFLVKHVDEELQIRMYPGDDLDVTVCLHSDVKDSCYKGETARFDSDFGGEIALGLNQDAHSYSISFSKAGIEYAVKGPFDMPEDDNVWEEQLNCESNAAVTDIEYRLIKTGQERIAYVSYYSFDPTSAQLCGIDEAGDNACLWEPMSAGEKKLKIRIEDGKSPQNVLIRDEKGCSVAFGPTI